MTDTAKLTIKVDSTSANKATAELDKLTASSKRAEAATESLGETDKQRTKRIRDMVQASLGQQKAMGGIVESERSLAERRKQTNTATATAEQLTRKEAEAFNAAVKAKQAAMARLNLAMKGNLATTAGMAEADAALDAAMATGAISAKEQEAYLKKLAVAEGIETATTEANTAAHVENAAALKLNSRAYSEIGTAVSEIAAGNFGRLRRTGAAFANQAGLFKKIFTPVGGAITATAVAAITLATAFAKGQGETTAYAKALAMTGDYAEVTTGQLQAMSQQLDTIPGITEHAASGILSMVVATGKFKSQSVQAIAKAALQMEELGQDTHDTVKQFEDIARDPVQALAKLNASMHFLHGSELQQIMALQEQGKQQQAVTLAQKTYAAAIEGMTHRVDDSLGLLQRGWRAVKNTASEAWDAMLDIGRTQSPEARIQAINTQLEAARKRLAALSGSSNPAAQNEARLQRGVVARLEAERTRLQRGLLSGLTWNTGDDDSKQRAALASELAYYDKTFNAQKHALDKENEQYRQAMLAKGLTDKEREQALKAHQQRIADIHAKYASHSPGGSAGSHATLADLQDNVAKMAARNGGAAQAGFEKASAQDAKRTTATYAYQQQLQSLMDTQKARYDLQEKSLGLSDQEIQKQQAKIQLDQEYNRELARITRDRNRGQISPEQFQSQLDALNNYYSQMQTITEDHFKKMDDARQNWLTGLQRGLAQVRDNGLNQAAQMTDLVTQGFNNLSDAVVNFATTGKFSLRSFATDFAKMLVKMEEEALAAKAASALLSYFFGGYTNNTYSTVGTDVSGSNIQFISGVSRSANGNVFTGAGIAAYENQIVSKPTHFYANGGNVMGEAGPEGIMPLKRMSNGKLGVYAMGGSDGDIIINTTVNVENGTATSDTDTQSNNKAAKQLAGMMEATAKQVVVRATQPGGILWKQRNGVPV